jgi:hypothetical protein
MADSFEHTRSQAEALAVPPSRRPAAIDLTEEAFTLTWFRYNVLVSPPVCAVSDMAAPGPCRRAQHKEQAWLSREEIAHWQNWCAPRPVT